jgi:hypothetical protein
MSLAVGTTHEGADVMGDNICIDSCPGGSSSIIYLRVPEGQTCAQLDGTEQTIVARTNTGGVEQKTFCLPNQIVEY